MQRFVFALELLHNWAVEPIWDFIEFLVFVLWSTKGGRFLRVAFTSRSHFPSVRKRDRTQQRTAGC